MKWILKALLQRGLSSLPNPHRWNYFFQSKVSKNLPVSDEVFFERFAYAKERLDLYRQYGTKSLHEINCFEFGAGWDLGGPIAYYAMGINRQLVIDIREGLRLELLNDQLSKLSRHASRLKQQFGVEIRIPSVATVHSIEELERLFGITYKAPSDARATGLEGGSIDLISTNSTLEHIPAEDVQKILHESYRILAADGITVHFIDMKDHFSYFDGSVSVYHFLTHNRMLWKIVNSDLQYQNRLRISDYQRMFSKARFITLAEKITWPDASELDSLRSLKLTSEFVDYSEAELSAKIVGIVSKKIP